MNPLLIAAATAGVLLAVAVCVTLWPRARSGDADLERRLRLVAATLAGSATAVDDADGGLFRRRADKFWLYDRIERRFSMLEGRRALPKAVALGFLLAVAAGVAALLMRFGMLSALVVPVAWVAGSWGLLRMWDASRRADFVKRFPEVVDHVVRLTRTGLPPVEAIAVVAEEAQGPVKQVMQEVSDDLSSGLDPEVVLRGTAARVRIPEFTLFSAALCLQRTTGGAISAALGNLSATLRSRMEVEMKAHASTAQTRITLWVLSAVPVLVVTAQSYLNPSALQELSRNPALLRLGVGLIVLGLLIARGIASRFGR